MEPNLRLIAVVFAWRQLLTILIALSEYVSKMDDPHARSICDCLIQDPDEDSSQPKLCDIEVVRAVLRGKFFDLNYLQDKIETIVHKWNCGVFGRLDPELIRCEYRLPTKNSRVAINVSKEDRVYIEDPRSARKVKRPRDEGAVALDEKEIEALQETRDNLRQEHGEDPLEASRQLAAEAGLEDLEEVLSPAMKRVRDMEMENELSMELVEEDDEDDMDRAKLTDLPEKAGLKKKRRKSDPGKRFRGTEPDAGIFDEQGKVTRRRKWTEEEKNAVKTGVKKYGPGKWAVIKDEYPDILRNRTGVQIKDVWRTMQNNREVA